MSRADIFADIACALGPGDTETRRSVARDRLGARPRQTPPTFDVSTLTELARRFTQQAQNHLACVVSVSELAHCQSALSAYLDAHALPRRIAFGADPLLNAQQWTRLGAFEVVPQDDLSGPVVGLSRAAAGIAETGSVMLTSGPDNPTPIAFLSETHVVILLARDLAATPEDAFDRIRRSTDRTMPRSLNLIAGPSRTADIGGNIVIGAHGPRRLLVLLVRDSPKID